MTDEREDWDALQEVTAELEQAEARIEELEAKLEGRKKLILTLAGDKIDLVSELVGVKFKLAKAVKGLENSRDEIDAYIRQEYPQDNPLHERYRQRDFSGNPARIALAELKGETQ